LDDQRVLVWRIQQLMEKLRLGNDMDANEDEMELEVASQHLSQGSATPGIVGVPRVPHLPGIGSLPISPIKPNDPNQPIQPTTAGLQINEPVTEAKTEEKKEPGDEIIQYLNKHLVKQLDQVQSHTFAELKRKYDSGRESTVMAPTTRRQLSNIQDQSNMPYYALLVSQYPEYNPIDVVLSFVSYLNYSSRGSQAQRPAHWNVKDEMRPLEQISIFAREGGPKNYQTDFENHKELIDRVHTGMPIVTHD